MILKRLIERSLVNVRCLYASQLELSNHGKHAFYEQLLTCISSREHSEIHIIGGDCNAHVGKESVTFDNYHVGKGYGTINRAEGLRILDLCSATYLAVSKVFFDKYQNKLITLPSAENNSLIDYIVVKSSFLKHTRDVNVIHNKECILQHKLLVADITVPCSISQTSYCSSKKKDMETQRSNYS